MGIFAQFLHFYVDFAGLPGVPFNVLYVENQELTMFFSFKHGTGQNTANGNSLITIIHLIYNA